MDLFDLKHLRIFILYKFDFGDSQPHLESIQSDAIYNRKTEHVIVVEMDESDEQLRGKTLLHL